MATFGLVHGSGLGPWSWDLLRPLLEKDGHTTIALDLPLDTDGLESVVDIGSAVLKYAEPPLIVVGHALGCTVLPLIAARANASLMIWVCGMIPISGLSATDQIDRDSSMVPMFRQRDTESGQLPQDAFVDSLVHDCPPDVRDWAAGRLAVAKHVECATTVVNERFPENGLPDIPSVYLLAADDRALAASHARAGARELLGVTAIELPGGHCPIFSRPEALSGIILDAADRVRESK